jgi:hypothetical protein
MRHGFGNSAWAGIAALLVVTTPVATRAAEPPVEATPVAPEEAKPAPRGERLELPPLGFDLLGAPALPPVPVDEGKMRWRRRLLQWHQGVGLGLFGLTLATTVVGQLNYSDRFAGGPSTGKYMGTHQVLSYTTLIAFGGDGALALLAPRPFERQGGFDRVDLHKISMAAATAGMVAQGVIGVMTRQREGYLNQERYARVHLVIGYATLAAVATGVGALIF